MNGGLENEFIPAAEGKSGRLLVMLHGLGDSLEGYRWVPDALRLPWLNYLLVNAPDPYYGGFSWYDFAGDSAPGVRRSRELLFTVIDGQREKGFAVEQMVLGGFSQGCLMSLEVGLRYPQRFAGILGISGYICEPQKLVEELSPVARQQRILMTHGTMDPMIPIAGVRAQVELLKQAGVQIQWHEFFKGHEIAGETELELLRQFIRESY